MLRIKRLTAQALTFVAALLAGCGPRLSFKLAQVGPLVAGAADTNFATGASETVKRWARDLWIELPTEIYFGRMMRENDKNAIIEVKTELEGQPGDRVTFTLLQKLAAAATTGDTTLEGNEEAMAYYSDSATLDQNRNAVRLAGKMSERRTAFSQRDSAKSILKTWLAETIDNAVFTGFDNSPTLTLYGGSASSTATIDASSKLTTNLLDRLVGKAKKVTPKIWPVKVNGRDLYVTLIHTDVAYDLRQDGTWTQAQRDAQLRGGDNPLFSGALGVYNGNLVHEHEKVPISTTYGAGSNLPGASNFFMGRQAGVFAWGSRPEWWEKEFDYGNKTGFAIGAIYVFKKAVFNATDHAFISAKTYRTNL